jgi:hypothetical protein
MAHRGRLRLGHLSISSATLYQLRGDKSGKSDAEVVITDREMAAFQASLPFQAS